ncbi:hypothetical protein ANN_20319 [Periplaneta americana]|uniref:Uncharacterized protein n=1 Tax=Periplaneta americana TaxID=6978 RepID=A0ABQ8SCP5_PERAM|nr:hypothetical protein ANN_20319 [Periplaneta americana]
MPQGVPVIVHSGPYVALSQAVNCKESSTLLPTWGVCSFACFLKTQQAAAVGMPADQRKEAITACTGRLAQIKTERTESLGEFFLRKLHNAELHALYSSPDIIRNIKSRRLRWPGHVARMGKSRNAYRVLVGRPEGKRPLGRPRRRWEDNIKMDLREVGYDDRDWINLAQDRERWRAYVRAAMNLRVP